METIVRKLTLEQTAEIYQKWIYEHFPKDEVKPLKNIRDMWSRGCYRALGLYDASGKNAYIENGKEDSELIGYAFFVSLPDSDMILLDYLAVLSDYRSLGLGSEFLKKMKAVLQPEYKGILIETEDIERAVNEEELRTRKRRDSFYAENGAVPTGIKSEVYGVPYTIWIYRTDDQKAESGYEENLKGLKRIYETMFLPERFGTQVFIYG